MPDTQAHDSATDVAPRYPWLTATVQRQVRGILVGLALFVGLAVWVWHSLGIATPASPVMAHKLRVVGIMTWLYALVQIVDMRFWHSGVAERRRAAMRIPESLIAWLFGELLACFGILYYGFTEDVRWFVAGLLLLLVTFAAFPIRRDV